jgi:hypothetical protein
MPEKTFTGINLSGEDYTIPGPGVYEITNAQTNNLIFPNPTTYDGQKITIVNTDGTYDAAIDNTNTFSPYSRGTGTQLSDIILESMWQFISIGGKWRGIKSAT